MGIICPLLTVNYAVKTLIIRRNEVNRVQKLR